jgi:hypothetical protein
MKKLPHTFSGIVFSGILLAGLIITGCTYDKEDVLYPPVAGCDTVVVTYAASVAPIMNSSCNVCHSTTVATAGVITDNYEGLKIIAQDGRLWGTVSHTGAIKMPKDAPKLSDCNLAKIQKWIDAGYPNN